MLISLPKTTIDLRAENACHLIAEIGLNHNGSLELAKNLVYNSVLSGSQLLKFQKREPASLCIPSKLNEKFTKCPGLGNDQRLLRESHELSDNDFGELIRYASTFNAKIFTSVFDIPSLNFAEKIGIDLVKIASHSATNGPLLELVKQKNIKAIISTGALTQKEINEVVSYFPSGQIALMHCVSSYPTQPKDAFLGTITALKSTFPNIPIGYSSHEIGIDLSMCAAALGASFIERHITLSNSMQGFDHSISLLPSEFAELSSKIRDIVKSKGAKTIVLPAEEQVRKDYHVGIYAQDYISAGTVIKPDMISTMQPANDRNIFYTGLEFNSIIGKTLSVDVDKFDQIARNMIT